MTQKLDSETARLLLQSWGTWFGAPPVEFGGQLVDGRVRFREAVSLGMGAAVPKRLVVILRSDVAKYLCLAGHFDRAREYVPSMLIDARDVAAYCHCRIEVVAPMCRKIHLVVPRMRVHTPAARRRAIERIAIALRAAEQGDGFVSAEQLRKALEQWL